MTEIMGRKRAELPTHVRARWAWRHGTRKMRRAVAGQVYPVSRIAQGIAMI